MKKLTILTVIALLGASISLTAQETVAPVAKQKYVISKGTKLTIAGISGNYIKPNGGYGSGNITVFHQSGYFVANNLSVGINMGYDFSRSKTDINLFPNTPIHVTHSSHTILPGVFLRYYKMFSPKFGLFGQFKALYTAQFMNARSNDPAFASKGKSMGVDVNITPNLVYFITNKLAIEGGFGAISYGFRKDMNTNSTTHSAGFSVNPSLTIGLSLYLGKGVVAKG